MAGRSIKLGNALKELRIHFCQTSDASKGVRDFVEKFYVPLKQANPKFPILIRECSGVQPRVWARYGYGKESSVSLTNAQAENVLKEIEKLAAKN
ncbi:NADH dehydrogenase [ubiquinone] 1 alpha subcomplex subunit 2 [Homalodisca vitripennis]|uniref:NADH dehydrogenase [ubiquinone] 1 alpha subcomplex subunit 2 n=1 Tax=Homalodisca vitripennis TaxID=197043 RepID=UPI001EEA0A4B|nr:NADH dehydrogenase [ubiquinone] 1 alpha subcomplex subunit 2 [Homalodisca vitripennis]